MTDQRRLLWLTEHHPPARGGMAQSCSRIIAGLCSRGWSVDVCHITPPHRSLPGRSYQWQRSLSGGYQWIPATPDPYHAMRVNLGLLDNDDRQWDGLVAYGGRLPAEMAPVLAGLLKLPLALLLRGNDFDLGILRAKHRTVLAEAISSSQLTCTVTESMEREIATLYPQAKVKTVANGIDLEEWSPLPSETARAIRWREALGTEPVVIALIGQLKEKKGGAFLVRALNAVAEQRNVHLLLVGEADESLESALAECHHPVTRMPFLDRSELIPWYLASDIVALPSFYDGLPNVMLEAMGLSRPLIAARIGGMADHLVDDEHGWLFPPADFDGLRLALERAVMADANERMRLGANGRQLVAEKLTAAIETDQYDQLLTNLIGNCP